MVQRVGVIGAGLMGSGIAEVAAKAGSDVLVWDAKQEFADAGTVSYTHLTLPTKA